MSDKAMSWASYFGAFTSVFAGLTLTEWGIIVGIVTALLTFIANQVYTYRKDRRDKQLSESQLRLNRLQEQIFSRNVTGQSSQSCEVEE